jgi:hypothetical protein
MKIWWSKDEIQDLIVKKKKGDKVTWHEREMKEEKEIICHQGYTEALFFRHSVPLEGFRRDDSNYTLKDHKKRL